MRFGSFCLSVTAFDTFDGQMTIIRRLIPTAAAILALSAVSAGAQGRTTVRIGIPEPDNIQYLSLWVALGAGYLQAEGIEPEVVFAAIPKQSGQLLLQRQADVALLQPPVYLGLIAQAQPIVLFANLLANDPINLVVRADVAAKLKLDPRAPLADRLNAVKGLRIGVAPEPPRRLRVLFSSVGLDADRDVTITIVRGDDQIAALTAGRVDALYSHTPFLEDALVTHGAMLLVNQSAGEVAALTSGQMHSLGALREFADARPDVVLSVTRAIARAQTLLHTDAGAAARALTRAGVPAPTPRHLTTVVGLYRAAVPKTPHVSAAAVERNAILYPARPAMPDFAKVRAADFLAPGFAEKASGPRP
jgi:NitT/TauT family transport system substrate-binding protein